MLKTSLVALATVIGASAALPSIASAIDKVPCDHCTMEPIVVKGDRKKTKSTGNNAQQAPLGVGLQIVVNQ
jgi:hypothetical protein